MQMGKFSCNSAVLAPFSSVRHTLQNKVFRARTL